MLGTASREATDLQGESLSVSCSRACGIPVHNLCAFGASPRVPSPLPAVDVLGHIGQLIAHDLQLHPEVKCGLSY